MEPGTCREEEDVVVGGFTLWGSMALRGRVFDDGTGGLSDPFSLTERCLTMGMTAALCMAGTARPEEVFSDGGG